MRAPTFMLATSLLIPSAAVAQSLDLTEDSIQPDSELDTTTLNRPDLQNLGSHADSTRPVLIEPKFDMTAEPDNSGPSNNLDQREPDPTPGLIIKIPTN